MIAVIFEVTPREGRADDYFDLAVSLMPEVERIDGFISVERYQSTTNPNKYVSLSFWRDDASVAAWRAHAGHGVAQKRGKEEIFADFRIRIATVERDYTLADRIAAD